MKPDTVVDSETVNTLILDYIQAKPLELPLKHKDNPEIITVSTLNLKCKRCAGQTEDLRGTSTEHSACLEIKVGGICRPCKTITWGRLRIYPDHMLSWQDHGLAEHSLHKASWLKKLKKLIFGV